MSEGSFEIVCELCPCHFSPAELNEDEILCRTCGHSLDDDHGTAALLVDVEVAST